MDRVWQGWLKPQVVSWARRFKEHALDRDYLCRGVALGLLLGFIMPPGAQMAIAAVLSPCCRANPVAACLSVWVSNPLTMPLIYPVALYLGGTLSGVETIHLTGPGQHNWSSLLTDHHLQLQVTLALGLGLILMGITSALLGYGMTWLFSDRIIAGIRHFAHEAHLPRHTTPQNKE